MKIENPNWLDVMKKSNLLEFNMKSGAECQKVTNAYPKFSYLSLSIVLNFPLYYKYFLCADYLSAFLPPTFLTKCVCGLL